MARIRGGQIQHGTVTGIHLEDKSIEGVDIADRALEGVHLKLNTVEHENLNINWKESVATASSLPSSNNYNGDARITLDDGSIYIYYGGQWNQSQSIQGGYDSTDFDNDLSIKTTDDLAEGSINKYFYSHDNTNHTETYITSSGVTFENLNANGDIGSGPERVASGDHNHDDLYYTETEVDNLLSNKSNTTHSHNDLYYTETEVDTFLSGKSDTTHDHDADYSSITHNHDDLYYTETEVDTFLSGKSDTTHDHDADYSSITHNHDTTYSNINHDHNTEYSNITHNHDTTYLSLSGGTITGNVIPSSISVNLGSSSNKFGEIHAQTGYFDASTIYLGTESISIVDNKISFSKGISLPADGRVDTDIINLTSVNPADTATMFGSDNSGDSVFHIRVGNGSGDKILFESWNGTSASSLLEIGQTDVTIIGNLNVTGTTTTINSTTVSINDNEFMLNSGVTGTPTTNAAIVVERGTSSNAQIVWNEGSDVWELNNGSISSEIVTVSLGDGRYLLETNNLGDLTDAATARTNLGLTGASNTTHYHDGRYYTESEANNNFVNVSGDTMTAPLKIETGSYATVNDTKLDASLVIDKASYIYFDQNGDYLRTIIGTDSNGIIDIGQDGTAIIDGIALRPGSGGTVKTYYNGSVKTEVTSTGLSVTGDVSANNINDTNWNSAYSDTSSATDSATASTLMKRNSSGDVWCRLFRSNYSSTNSNIAGIYTTQSIGGDYMRPSTTAQLAAQMKTDDVIVSYSGATKTAGNFYTGTTAPTSSNRLNYDGYFYATRVYNAVYNDFADYQALNPTEDKLYGKAYYRKFGVMSLCNKRCQKGVSGIASDTHGIAVGSTEKDVAIPLAVAGWALAHVDKEYDTGTALVNDKNGTLTKARIYEKVFFPERIIATYDRREHSETWGPDNITVDNRSWVKIK